MAAGRATSRRSETIEGVWAFRREGGALVALNLGERSARIDGVNGAIVLGTRREREGEPIDGRLELGPREAVVASSAVLAA